MRIVLKLSVGIALTWWACWLMEWPFGDLSGKPLAALFLLLLAGSVMNMNTTRK